MPSRRTEVHRSFDNLISIHHLSHLHHCCPDTPSGDFLPSGHTNMHRRITHVVADKLLIVQTVLCKALRTVWRVFVRSTLAQPSHHFCLQLSHSRVTSSVDVHFSHASRTMASLSLMKMKVVYKDFDQAKGRQRNIAMAKTDKAENISMHVQITAGL